MGGNGSVGGRREFLKGAGLAAASLLSRVGVAQTGLFGHGRRAKAAAPAQPMVYFGTDTTRPGAEGIYAARFNSSTGQFGALQLAAKTVRPSFMARGAGPGRSMLYAVNEGGEQDSGVSTFSVDPGTGALRFLGQVASGGAAPCFVSVDVSGHSAFVANYLGGTVAGFAVKADGTLTPAARVDLHDAKFGTPGPVKSRQDGPHPHCAVLTPRDRFLVVCDLGLDSIVTFPVDAATGVLGAAHVTTTHAGVGPRHVVVHPNGRWLYCVEELANRVDQYLWTATHGTGAQPGEALLTDTGHPVSTLAADFKGTNTAAEIAVSPGGRFVYVSNRGEDSLVVFAVDGGSGALTVVQRIPCGGKTPRQFTLDPSGRWLLCGNQDSGTVAVFARSDADGRLTGPVHTLAVPAPQMILFG